MILAPTITLPTGGEDYTTDVRTQTLSGQTMSNTGHIEVNGSTFGVSYTPGETVWSWTADLPIGENTVNIVAIEKETLTPSDPATIKIKVVETDDFITVSPPTGIKLRRYQNQVEVVNAANRESQVVGYNYYVATTSGGVNNLYAKFNNELVTDVSFVDEKVKNLGRTVDTAGNIRETTVVDEIIQTDYFSMFFTEAIYNTLVQAGSIPDVGFNEDTPLYFVATAVIYDTVLGQVTESTYSAELEGAPITITTGLETLPSRTQTDIVLTYSRDLLASDDGVDTKPGTVLRDTLDPISEEQARVYVIQDFMSRSLSVSSLLDFDDADGDGVSDPVATSTPKRALQVALNLTDTADVQSLIDTQFDKLAANVNVTRRGAVPATGNVIFYTDTAPIRDMTVVEGGIVSTQGDLDSGVPAQDYIILATRTLDFANKDRFYNTVTKRYELEVQAEALVAGEDGNTNSYTINSIGSGVDSDFLVENPNAISFGRDIESNHDLATRTMLAFFTDTGTEGGYAKTAIGVQGVRNVRVEKADDEFMRRDYDAVREKHVGGKVDIYVEGVRLQTVTDQIAFSFDSIQTSEGTLQEERFNVINAAAFQFQSRNPNVTAHTPIFEVSKVHNATRGSDYDITGYQIIGDGDTIDLDETLAQNVAIGLATTDIIRVDYKYRSSDVFILDHQPVDEIVSVVGQISGALTTDNYELVKLQDPLEEGNSTIANDGIRIKFANNLPLTEFEEIVDESHVLILGVPESLELKGVDPTSITVTNTGKTLTYEENVDYQVSAGTDTTDTTIEIIESGRISNGQEVYVSYTAIENFIITYTNNGLLETVQEEVDKMKHACADVIVKQAVKNDVDFVMTVVPKSGVTNLTQLTSQIQTAVSNYVSQLGVGRSLAQSEVVHVINDLDDVDYLIVPFRRMVKADGSFIIRDELGTPQFQIYNEGSVTSYITSNVVLNYNTVENGGPDNLFRGIFEDNMPLVLQDDALEVSDGPGRAYIQSDGKIVVSTRDGDLPDTKVYQAAYYAQGETGAEDILVTPVEYLEVGTFSVTYDTPRDLSRQAF